MRFLYTGSLLMLITLLGTQSVQAQNTFSGTVYDAQTRLPLPGVNVLPADNDRAAVTDGKGRFMLPNVALPNTLGFSFVGYQPGQIRVESAGEPIRVYLEPLDVPLTEVVVTGYENNRKLLETAGSVALVEPKDLERFSNTSLVPALNTVPGVRLEERSPGSYRVSIRGSTLRSPFGVRNVKIYWNDIPLTDPSGNTALNLIDFRTVGKVEIIKGPGGSLYGAGTGGVILLQSPRATFGEQNAEGAALFGSFGLRGYSGLVRTGGEQENTVVTYAKQQSDGYRAHSALDREVVNVRAQFYPGPKRTVSFNGFYADLFYQIPGGLNAAEFTRNPRLSRPLAIEQNSSIRLKTLNLGLAQTYQFSEHFSNVTSFYGTLSQFENPFITDYKRNTEQGLGGRTKLVYATEWGSTKGRFTLGGEFQTNFTAFRNYANIGGRLDTLRFDDEITAFQALLFAQAEVDLPRNYFLTLGGSYNRLRYGIARLSDASFNPDYARERRFNPALSPRIALLKKINPALSVHGSVSFGFSPPTIDDVRTSDGGVNVDLEAEKGVSYEIGLRGSALKNRLDVDATLFSLQLSNTITTYTNAQGVALFRNAGNTSQRGLEVKTSVRLVENPAGIVSRVGGFVSYTYSDFRFEGYVNNNADLSGNWLTGTPRHTGAAGLDVATKPGFYTNITLNYVDRIPLNDANTVYADSYALLGSRLGYRKTFAHLTVAIFGGVDNVLDQTYSLGNDLNAFGGRYYQPAPGINYYSGASLTLKR
ncbi:MAG: TonB-dependent receptor plug domain-containing protein [Ferruginibacter sp.]|nr:TonB-dependent receptor plug domain-containing protein [Cytophagales bacterium]